MYFNLAPSKDWAAQKLQVRIIVVTGFVRPGMSGTSVHSPHGDVKGDVWLWQHPVVDGEGKSATHYDLISLEYAFLNGDEPIPEEDCNPPSSTTCLTLFPLFKNRQHFSVHVK